MADRPQDDEPLPSDGYDSEAPLVEPEHRREASARFVVQGGQSSTAELREAMDPANQSLADALRLSYRVLQAGILVLIVIFLLSGFQTVREGATGVKTIFGKIVGDSGGEQLAPGLQPFWPYPVGELVVFEQKVTVPLDREFEPRDRENQRTKVDQIDAAEPGRDLIAGRDGFVLTADGDIAHVAVTATFTVGDAVDFLRETSPEKVRQLLRSTLMRATVLAAGKFSLREFLDQREAPAIEIRTTAQDFLNQLNVGITVGEVAFIDRSPPRFVDSKFREVQFKRAEATAVVERANQDVAETLTNVVGEHAFDEVWAMIGEYDLALVREDAKAADELAQKIGERLERDDVSGEVASTIQRAKARASTMEAILARDLSRIHGLAPAFENDPRQITRQLWLEAIRSLMASRELEVISPPSQVGVFDLNIKSSQQVMQVRREEQLKRLKQAAEGVNPFEYSVLRGGQINPGEDIKRLDRDTKKGTGR